MVVTHIGTPWLGALGHVVKEKSYSFDTATILRQHSEDEAAGDWDRVMSTKVVTHKSVQVDFWQKSQMS